MKENSREYQKAVDYICSEIANGNISIGDRLPTERTLSGQLGISRNSTREALRSLENMGTDKLIQDLRNAGVKVDSYVSPGTLHEWLTWRRCLKAFVPHLFKK